MDVRRILEIDRRFFEKYQRQLLWLVNTRIGRWYFRIQNDHPGDRRFVRILPHALEWELGDGRKAIAFKTADRYANRLKHSLRHVKAFLIALGAGMAPSPEGAVALQFLFAGITTSFYPDPDTETTTVDGYAQHGGVSLSWSDIRSGAGNFSEDNNEDYIFAYWLATAVSNQWDTVARSIFLFDTAAIDAASTISSASFKFYCVTKTAPTDADATKRELRVVSSSPAANTSITGTDYATLGTTTFGAFSYAGLTTGAVNTVALNASGLANITKGGISKFGARSGADQDNSAPTWASGDTYAVYGRFAEYTGTASDPTLEVVYSAVLTVSDSVSMSDAKSNAPGRTLAETVGSSDSQSNLLVRVLTATETQATSDSLGPKSVARTVAETVSASDAVQKSVGRAIVDIISSGESVVTSLTAIRSFLETVTLSDVIFFWRPRTRPSTSWGDRSVPASSWTDRTPPSTPWS